MSDPQPPVPTCPVIMWDRNPCGRLLHRIQHGDDRQHVCLMHTHDPDKDWDVFWGEIQNLFKKTIRREPPPHDFSYFVFTQDADFSDATFTQDAYFIGATFTQDASFSFATFTQDANFRYATFTKNASFPGATFTEDAVFIRATFTQNADFRGVTFTERGHFHRTSFGQVADFRGATFEKPNRLLFHRVNEKSRPGMRARFVNCLLEGVRFEDVNWHRERGRIFLQDEADLVGTPNSPPTATHELVADAYRGLVNNFEENRQYELAEECVIGEMEMRRRNPNGFLFASWARLEQKPRWKFWHPLLIRIGKQFKSWYDKFRFARLLGEHFSFLYIYRALSTYGSNYSRALRWLLAIVFLIFPIIFGFMSVQRNDEAWGFRFYRPMRLSADDFVPWREAAHLEKLNNARGADLLYAYFNLAVFSAEVATFQRDRLLLPFSLPAKFLVVIEQVLVPGQLALFLFALRRRFRR